MKTTNDFPDDPMEGLLQRVREAWERGLEDPDPKIRVDAAHSLMSFMHPEPGQPRIIPDDLLSGEDKALLERIQQAHPEVEDDASE